MELTGSRVFVPALKLNEAFFRHVVSPTMSARWPGLKYSAGLVGWGSDVLGYDTARSMDHMWGLRLCLFVREQDHSKYAADIHEHLRWNLPRQFRGFSTHFGASDAVGVRRNAVSDSGPVEHMIEVATPNSFVRRYLGVDSTRRMKLTDWLRFREQALLEVTGGRIYHDGLGQMEPLRQRLAYYPRDIWLHKLALAWQDLTDEEAFPGRCDELGDAIGRDVLVARQVQRVMRLCFLLEKRYSPYSKWLGTAFSRLRSSTRLGPLLQKVLGSASWSAREKALIACYESVARVHNRLGITRRIPDKATLYYGRPYLVIWGDRFAVATRDAIRSRDIRDRTRVKAH